jgi:hypothetical protein
MQAANHGINSGPYLAADKSHLGQDTEGRV